MVPQGVDADQDGLDDQFDADTADATAAASKGIVKFANSDGDYDSLPDYLDTDSDQTGN
ncbi:MAG: hypothetical protein R3E89_05980 [Thiolinea sp.]